MVSVIFVVLEVSFWALTTVVKLPWKFLTLIRYTVKMCYKALATEFRPGSRSLENEPARDAHAKLPVKKTVVWKYCSAESSSQRAAGIDTFKSNINLICCIFFRLLLQLIFTLFSSFVLHIIHIVLHIICHYAVSQMERYLFQIQPETIK